MNIRKILLVLLTLFIGGTISAQGIKFYNTLDEAFTKAKQEDKLIFIDFYTSW